jgi:hypothetical protein
MEPDGLAGLVLSVPRLTHLTHLSEPTSLTCDGLSHIAMPLSQFSRPVSQTPPVTTKTQSCLIQGGEHSITRLSHNKKTAFLQRTSSHRIKLEVSTHWAPMRPPSVVRWCPTSVLSDLRVTTSDVEQEVRTHGTGSNGP